MIQRFVNQWKSDGSTLHYSNPIQTYISRELSLTLNNDLTFSYVCKKGYYLMKMKGIFGFWMLSDRKIILIFDSESIKNMLSVWPLSSTEKRKIYEPKILELAKTQKGK